MMLRLVLERACKERQSPIAVLEIDHREVHREKRTARYKRQKMNKRSTRDRTRGNAELS